MRVEEYAQLVKDALREHTETTKRTKARGKRREQKAARKEKRALWVTPVPSSFTVIEPYNKTREMKRRKKS